MKLKLAFVFLLFFMFTLVINGQNSDNKWTFGLSLAVAKFTDFQGSVLGGAFVNQTPRLTISRYLFNNLTMVGSYATSALDTQKHTTLDGALRYDFGASYDNVVPYVLLGGSFVTAQQLTPTLNFGVGNTFWFSPSYGVNFQLIYKYSEDRFQSQYSHFYPSIGLVYSFKPRNMNMRLWDRKH
jgi:hypothetical protein